MSLPSHFLSASRAEAYRSAPLVGDTTDVGKFCEVHPFAYLKPPDKPNFSDHDFGFSHLEGEFSGVFREPPQRPYNAPSYVHGKNYNSLNVELGFDEIIGLEEAARLLVDVVGKPLAFPEHYGKFRSDETDFMAYPNKFACIYGHEGSGKRTLVIAFAERYSINLLHVRGDFNVVGMMEKLLEFAEANAPALIYFDHCCHFFGEGDLRMFGKEFAYYYESRESSQHNVWVVFGSKILPVQLQAFFQKKLGKNTRFARPPGPDDRHLLFHRFLQSRYTTVGYSNFSDEDYESLLSELVAVSDQSTPDMIRTFCRDAFATKRQTCSLATLRDNGPHSLCLLPDIPCFRHNMIRTGNSSSSMVRISQEIPHALMKPYEDYSRNSTAESTLEEREKKIFATRQRETFGNPPLDVLRSASMGCTPSSIGSPLVPRNLLQQQHNQQRAGLSASNGTLPKFNSPLLPPPGQNSISAITNTNNSITKVLSKVLDNNETTTTSQPPPLPPSPLTTTDSQMPDPQPKMDSAAIPKTNTSTPAVDAVRTKPPAPRPNIKKAPLAPKKASDTVKTVSDAKTALVTKSPQKPTVNSAAKPTVPGTASKTPTPRTAGTDNSKTPQNPPLIRKKPDSTTTPIKKVPITATKKDTPNGKTPIPASTTTTTPIPTTPKKTILSKRPVPESVKIQSKPSVPEGSTIPPPRPLAKRRKLTENADDDEKYF